MNKSSNDIINNKSSPTPTSNKSNFIIGLSGILLLIGFSLIAYISPDFSESIPEVQKPVLLLVAILVFSGALYLFTVFKTPKTDLRKNQLIWVIGIGIILRVLMLFTAPILEDDYFRYLWDGAVTANAISPYTYSPQEVLEGADIPPELSELANESGDIIHGINHPEIRTIYPPIAQAFFALSYWLDSWNLISWKLILIIFDLATLSLILNALGILKLPSSFLIIYWWNPLLLKEIFNSGHLDVLAFPFVLSALIMASQNRHIRSTLTLIIAVGIKLWPAFLLPVILRPIISKPKKLLSALVVAAISIGILFLPIYLSGLDHSSGLIAYGQSWQNNDSAFRILIFISELGLNLLGYETFHKYTVARFLVIALIAIWIAYITLGKTFKNDDLFKKSLLIVAFVFLISPAQFPWYYTWLIPFLAIKPRFSLLSLTALLPLYYLQYYFEPRGEIEIFTKVIVWIEFVPVWILLIWEWRKNRALVSTN
jgi:alpha-1,6-mannosyltransferase